MNAAPPTRQELILRAIAVALAGIDSSIDPDKYATRVSRVERYWINADDVAEGIALMLMSTADAPWEDRARGGILAGGGTGKGIQEIRTDFSVEAIVKAEVLLDSELVSLCGDVMRAVLDEPTFGGLAQKTRWVRSQRSFATPDAGDPHGMCKVDFAVFYRTEFARPGTAVA